MKRLALATSFLLSFIVMTGASQAEETVAQARAAEISNPRVIAVADVMNNACGSKAEVMVEWNTFPVEIVGARNPALWCNQALETLIYMCQGSPAFKQAFSNTVKVISCQQGAGKDPAHPFSLSSDGRLTYAIDWQTVNLPDVLTTFILTNK